MTAHTSIRRPLRRPALAAAAAAVALTLLAAAVAPADAHGYLAVPKSRNKIAHERGEYYVSVGSAERRAGRGRDQKLARGVS